MGWGKGVKNAVAVERGLSCQVCGKHVEKASRLQGHHIKFKRDGGSNIPSNMELVCPECHREIHHIVCRNKRTYKGARHAVSKRADQKVRRSKRVALRQVRKRLEIRLDARRPPQNTDFFGGYGCGQQLPASLSLVPPKRPQGHSRHAKQIRKGGRRKARFYRR